MSRTCAACGGPLASKNPRARYCSATCRARVSKGLVVPIADRVAGVPVSPESDLVCATRAALEAADRLGTIQGEALLDLVQTISDPNTPPAAKVAAHRQLPVTQDAAFKGVRAMSPVDELRRRRDVKRNTG